LKDLPSSVSENYEYYNFQPGVEEEIYKRIDKIEDFIKKHIEKENLRRDSIWKDIEKQLLKTISPI
jgi:hypothetical protein